jgi:hypothetical protein
MVLAAQLLPAFAPGMYGQPPHLPQQFLYAIVILQLHAGILFFGKKMATSWGWYGF